MKKTLPIALTLIVLVIAGFFAFNSYIYQEKQDTSPITTDPYRGTLSGTYTCLPHREQSGPQTMECAFGLQTETGEMYAVDWSLLSQEREQMSTGDRFSANGLITPIENLSSDHWQKYAIVGVFSVTDSVTKL